MWWIYFDRSAEAAAERIAASADPGRLGRSAYTFLHLLMVAGVIVSAGGTSWSSHTRTGMSRAVRLGGPALFVAGHALFKRPVFGGFGTARLLALAAPAVLAPVASLFDPLTPAFLTLAFLALLVTAALAGWDVRTSRAGTAAAGEPTA